MARDITELPDLAVEGGRVAPIRSRMPVYVDLLPPCNSGCPAGENIQEWLRLVKAGQEEAAWRELVKNNPFPAIHGRVCYHPCEAACNRVELDGSVSRMGHEVEIRDSSDSPGGMMRYGIPEYRLPRDVLDAEVSRLLDMGVRIVNNYTVKDLIADQAEGGFEAAFVAIGAHLSKRVDIPNRDASKIVDAVSFLRDVASGERPLIGRKVAIYGGGNTAMDAARVARRLGAEESIIVYRRTEEQMPAHAEEREGALREGVKMNWLRTISSLDEGDLTVEIMELDENGRAQGTGRFEKLEADTVILALGQEADSNFLRRIPGMHFEHDVVQVDPRTLMTGVPGIFAGGDAVPSERTVTIGVGHGKRAATQIDAWLAGREAVSRPKHDLASFEKLHLWYFGDARRSTQPELEPSERVTDFDEIVGGLTDEQAHVEAARCLSCGNCFECDGCLGACPEDAVIKLGKGLRYRFDYDKCTGCATCYGQCPVHAIDMIEEKR